MRVKFKLPVGALVNGWRHLGGGEFAATVGPQPSKFSIPPPLLVELTVPFDCGDGLGEPMVLEPFDDPLENVPCARTVSLTDISKVEAKIGAWPV